MLKKLTFILIPVLILITGCVSTLDWTKSDFEEYAASESGNREFPLKYVGHELNLKFHICCTDYLESEFTIDVLPVREIADYMEEKYGVSIDTSEYESHRKNGHFYINVTENSDGDEIIEFNDKYMTIDGLKIYGGILASGSWANISWSETPEIQDMFKYEQGMSNQMQIIIFTNPIGCWVRIWLRVKSDEPNRDGYYDMKIAAEERVDFDFKTNGCNLEDIKAALQTIPDLLRQQDMQ
jgi:hypothetical protein